MLGIMKVSQILFYLVLISLFSVPVSADLNIESVSIINITDKEAWGPAWSPDGNSIAYIAYDDSRNQQIFTINTDGTGKKQVTNDTIKKWGIAWLQDDISFLSYDTSGLQKIFLVKPDGSGMRKLLDDKTRQGRAEEDKPPALGGASWNPVTKTILFTSIDPRGDEKRNQVNLDGTGKKQVIADDLRQWNPQWGPDGNSFVYFSYDGKYRIQLFTINADGTGKKQITFDDLKKSDPSWGPDGILYVSYEDASSSGTKIFMINPDGAGKKRLTKDGFKERNPRWSRDGGKIIYEDITTQGLVTFKVLNLQKPAAIITPAETPAAAATKVTAASTGTPIATVIASPAVTGTATPAPTAAETPKNVETTPIKSALNDVISSMLIVLVTIVVVMLVILAISNTLSRKK